MLGTNRWAMFLIASLLIGATAALPAVSAQEVGGRPVPTNADPCDGDVDVTCQDGNEVCLVWNDGACTGEHPITPCHSRAELFCETDDGNVCTAWAVIEVLESRLGGCMAG